MIAGISKGRQTRYAYLLLLPAVIIAVVFTYLPSWYVFFLSFTDWDLISPVKENAGFSNYVRLLAADSDFWNSLLRTFLYTVFFIPSTLILSLFIAIRILGLGKFKGFFQSMFFIPSVTSISVISLVWSYLFNPQIGPVNNFLSMLGVSDSNLPQWLDSTTLALPTVAVIGVWQNIGFMTLLFISGLQNIPSAYYEVAQIDGAKRSTMFFRITLPLLSPVLYYVVFMLIINSFKMFDIISIMTKGRPQGTTNVVLYYIYQQGFQFFDAGLAAAASWMVFMLLLGVFILQQKIGEKNVHYQ